jgi:hypothetical protein
LYDTENSAAENDELCVVQFLTDAWERISIDVLRCGWIFGIDDSGHSYVGWPALEKQ